jgi:hypothetical protein
MSSNNYFFLLDEEERKQTTKSSEWKNQPKTVVGKVDLEKEGRLRRAAIKQGEWKRSKKARVVVENPGPSMVVMESQVVVDPDDDIFNDFYSDEEEVNCLYNCIDSE